MKITTHRFQVAKRFPLTISRGTSTGSENLLVTVTHDGVTGIGEMAPTSGGAVAETADSAERALQRWQPLLAALSPWQMQEIEARLDSKADPDPRSTDHDPRTTPPGSRSDHAARAALDMALYDWQGRCTGQPVWRLFGLELDRIPTTSITVGINPPDVVRARVQEILERTQARNLKVKLGSPDGIEADQAMFTAAQAAAAELAGNLPAPVNWRVDANGGWTVESAKRMIAWLGERGVEFVEQPLLRGREEGLAAIHADSPLPIFADESVYLAEDIPPIAAHIDGVNLKLMKCGGLREALRIIHTARAHGLRVMMGCMSETSLAITAAAHLSPLADALDLDSHLNLMPDPYVGATLQEGRILPTAEPGLGVRERAVS